MDCNQVFMILTRGPFPTGEAWDEEVEAHLETCGDCWRLAEALRPALEVFQEAVPPAESRDLPGYWGDARPASQVMAQLTSAVVGRTAIAPGVRRAGVRPQLASAREIRTFSRERLAALALAATITAVAVVALHFLRG